ncbi:hypothetical protein N0V90_009922 [Kalmusia sp. IMI 367209]|nr:hypothetical protein N0V90_009922 [Kalmusia sp. IMI 367209]
MIGHATAAATAHHDRQNALADIQFASIVDADLTPSEDETPEEPSLQLETVQSAIGVSIGQQQTRLTSPKTPAAEKAAALDEGDGGVLFEGWEQSLDQPAEQSAPRPIPRGTGSETANARERESSGGIEESQKEPLDRLPSPWSATSKTFTKSDNHRTALRDALNTKSRRRTMSGGASDYFKKYMPFNLPSMPKTSSLLNFSLPSFSVSSFDNVGRHPHAHAPEYRKRVLPPQRRGPSGLISQHDGTTLTRPERRRSRSHLRNHSRTRYAMTEPIRQRDSSPETGGDTDGTTTPDASDSEPHKRPPPALRRSNSEGSLLLYRPRSIASSLGDDSRFEHVSEQVNSRLKAIKDSWQDSNFKLSVPSMPNFGFSSRDDLFRNKNGISTPRGATGDRSSNVRVSFLANNSNTPSRRPSLRQAKAKTTSTETGGMSTGSAASHPYFMRALNEIEGDLVILGGYRGSILRSAEPPHRQLWVPIKVGLNLRKVDLEIGLSPDDEESMEERIIPGGMLTHIGPVDIAKRLFKRLRACQNARNGRLRVHDYGYDWRLSPHLLSRRMIKFLENLPCNQPDVPPEKRGAIIIAHSLGGLITRHVINQRPDLVAGVVYAGVPQRCINILGPLRNGDDVLLSSRVLTAQVNFTIRTSYALLPLDGKCFINKHTKEEYPVDFFDPKTWEEYRLSPCIAPAIPFQNATSSNLSVSGLLNAMSQALPSLPSRKNSMSLSKGSDSTPGSSNSPNLSTSALRDTTRNAANKLAEGSAQGTGFEPKMQPDLYSQAHFAPSITSTIPHDQAVEYLTRTLAEIKQFKKELDHRPELTAANVYPPIALIYGKSTPTVYGAKVESREAIKRTDAYDELAFASGDGVVLARAAMVPDGYSVVRGGVVPSERGHVTLLGDLEAVGKCLNAVMGARKNGIGLGDGARKGKEKSESLGVTT